MGPTARSRFLVRFMQNPESNRTNPELLPFPRGEMTHKLVVRLCHVCFSKLFEKLK